MLDTVYSNYWFLLNRPALFIKRVNWTDMAEVLTTDQQQKNDKLIFDIFCYYNQYYRRLLFPFQWLGIIGLVAVLWTSIDRVQLLVAAGALIAVYFLFDFYNFLYLRRQIERGTISFSAKAGLVALCSLCSCGFIFFAYMVFDYNDPAHLAYSLIAAFAMIAAPAVSLNYFPAYAGWNICQALGNFLIYYSIDRLPFAITVACIAMIYLYFCRRSSNIHFENVVLVERLSDEKQKAEGLAASLLEQKKRAEKANDSKSLFLAHASHDLRQPLQSISLFISVLTNSFTTDEQKRVGSKLARSVSALTRSFDSILDLSRLDAGVIKPNIRPIKLNKLLSRIETDFSAQADEKGLNLEVEYGGYCVLTDSPLLERILRNLLSNAIRYTDKGTVNVRTQALPVEGQGPATVAITVSDTGKGIATENQEDIFEEFTQLEDKQGRRAGLGLGLSIVRRLANVLGLNVQLRSEAGKGSDFTITVPLYKVLTADGLQKAETIAPVKQTSGLIYVIDDDIDIVDAYTVLLTSWNYRPVSFTSMAELEQEGSMDDEIPLAIIADYRLEGSRVGTEAIALIRNYFSSEIPAVIITGDTDPERLRRLSSTGLVVFHKPVSPDQISEYLSAVSL